MSSTNSTSHYELSQFVGSDKPAWLTDYNADMSKIDTGVYQAQTTATGADGKADANTTAIGTIANLTTDAKTNLVAAINEVDSHADTAQGTATNAATTAGSAKTTADGLALFVNINDYNNLTPVITTGTGTIVTSNMKIATNSDKSLAKIYGNITVNFSSSGGGIISMPSSLRPSSDITINGGLLFNLFPTAGDKVADAGNMSFTIKTNGDIEITEMNSSYWGSNAGNIKLTFINSVLFIKDFGDTPVNP